MPHDDWIHDDYEIPKSWPVERKWQRLRELLVGAVSVEVLDVETHYIFRVWMKKE